MKKQLLITISLLTFVISHAQTSSMWSSFNENQYKGIQKVKRNSSPNEYKLFSLDVNLLKNKLISAKSRNDSRGISNTIIELPNAEGNLEHYTVYEMPIMEPALAAQFPMIKSYAAQGIEDPTAVARFSVTQLGLHSMTLSGGKSTVFIDPYTEDRQTYIVYNKASLTKPLNDFECLTKSEINLPSLTTDRNSNPYQSLNTDDKKLRTYRLAQSCTAEYGNIFAGIGTDAQKKANIQAQMAITMTRVNGVYEKDLSITMIFIAANASLIYYGAVGSDPWSGEYNTQTGLTIDANVGFSSYDIGHNFNTSGGGNAGCIGCVAGPNTVPASGYHKGTGMTGRSNPTGDAFDIDYVAHEMGHQFGGFHVQSSSGCRSGNETTEVEPGSGSSIMGYAGICATNVQANSDAYFGYVNVRDISANVQSGVSSNIATTQITSFGNNPPTANAGADYVIPKSTAFVLEGTGSDPDGNAITYNWEQNDPGNPATSAAPTATRTIGPMFRSKTATTSPNRYMPLMATILTGSTSATMEVCPSVARDLNFSLTVRDNVATGGQTASDLMKVTVDATAGPFIMTAPNTNVSWAPGTNQTVTWNKANTDIGAVNTKFVDIYFSNNGGTTFPTLLASKVPNDGSETITIPNNAGSTSRIMVRGYNNIFLDVSNTSFTIPAAVSTFAVAFTGVVGSQNKTTCQGVNTVVYNFDYTAISGFSSTTNFTATGVPTGTTVIFSPTSRNTSGPVTMTVTTSATTPIAMHNIIVNAISVPATTTKTVPFYLEVLGSGFTVAGLISPANNAISQDTALNLTWSASTNATSYDVQVATDVAFTTIVVSGTTSTTSYSVSGLGNNISYYWRVLPKNASCSGVYGTAFKFTTGTINCGSTSSTNVPITISTAGSPTINSTLNIAAGGIISDINLTMNLSHTFMGQITATLIGPTGVQVKLVENMGYGDAIATFDDSGSFLSPLGTAPSILGTLLPLQSLSAFNGASSTGTWTLRIADGGNGAGGALNSWSLNICTVQPTLSNPDFEFVDLIIYPNPNSGVFTMKFTSASTNDIKVNVHDMRGRQVYEKSFSNSGAFNQNINLDKVGAGIYLVSIIDGAKKTVKRIIVE